MSRALRARLEQLQSEASELRSALVAIEPRIAEAQREADAAEAELRRVTEPLEKAVAENTTVLEAIARENSLPDHSDQLLACVAIVVALIVIPLFSKGCP